jgi:acetyltransferase-like isoleucine patch superfamily enzyme
VSMGAGSVAGAGALLTRDVPALAQCRGVPARVTGYRGRGDGGAAAGGDDQERQS